jgi:Tol biopolymer transport system component
MFSAAQREECECCHTFTSGAIMQFGSRRQLGAITWALMVTLCAASSAQAQYFGRNKVQYKDFQFEVLKTEHFHVYFYPDERAAVTDLARMAERWYARLSKIFNYDLSSPQPIVVYAAAPDFRQTNVISGEIGEGTGGVTEGAKRRIVLPLAGTLAETDHVLGHELVHAFQYDMARTGQVHTPNGGGGIERLPLWFIEGMAEYLSLGHLDPHTAMWIRDAARDDGKLPSIGDLNHQRYFPYRWGQALWAYVAGRWGDAAVETVFSGAVVAGDAEGALEKFTGLTAEELSRQWHEAIRTQYAPVLRSAARASSFGRLVTADQQNERALAVSPALSPDGSRVIYLSERDMLSIDLYLADATTGRVIRKLVNTAIDPHFSSIQFISSAGTWDPHGKQFAIGAIAQGRPVLAIIDVESGRRVREVPFPDLGEILNPSWSPDGRAIAFSALAAGRSDLFLFDVATGTTRRLTDDAFAELQPAWSPEGGQLAFVTDRFSTDLSQLKAGTLQLALLDIASGHIEPLPTPGGKAINPQWAPGGQKLYFLSDTTGITNVYALTLSSNVVSRLTNLDAGASGITALSPALSAASDANRVLFSAYDSGKIGIYLIEGRDALGGVVTSLENRPEAETAADWNAAAALPPVQRANAEVLALLSNAAFGLPQSVPAAEPYQAGLSLDAVGQPYVTAGVSRFGAMYGGGLSFALSDMLGNHNLFAAVDVNTSMGGFSDIYKNTGAIVSYTNLSRRWNWGVSGGQVPYLTGGYASGIATVNGQRALVEQEVIYRQTYRGANGMLAYPLSEVHRIEVGTGFQQVSFDQQVRTMAFNARTGELLSNTTETTKLADTLHLASTTVASVYDRSIAGATSPVSGQRSRLELTPTFGSLSYIGALADYRRYFMPARFYTIAGRVMHYGRYGRDGENSLLLPLYLGYPELIRGYTYGSFSSSECVSGPSGSCEAYDRLLGSRMLITNLELRFPLLRPFGVNSGMYGPLPVEVAFFTDAGLAWTKNDRPSFLGGNRSPVASAGVTFRTNLFGFAAGQLDFAYPFQRPGRGWVWSFSLAPGF